MCCIYPSRLSIDSTHSASPFIENIYQPPQNQLEGHVSARSGGAATKVRLSVVVLAYRILALISSLAIGVSFAILGAWWDGIIALSVFTWVSVVWDGLVLISYIRKPSLCQRISLTISS
ncbi:hypothetical protein F4824DRAFT_234826 [Ustulina deusta]|nr:hypothetical protein F4824DRAFT_234826 [Ustulina deusta]